MRIPTETPSFSPIRVLIVDDDEGFRTSLRDILEVFDFEVEVASSGSEALEMAGPFAPDCILMDIFMPGLTGIDTLRALEPLPPETFVVFMTGHAHYHREMEARRAGAVDVVSKPLDLKHLVSLIKATATERQVGLGMFALGVAARLESLHLSV